MTLQVSKEFIEFQSWDEVSEGDILHWMRGGKEVGYVVEFESVDTERHVLYGKGLKTPYVTTSNQWCDAIYPYPQSVSQSGWVLEQRQFKYDPAQAGDTEEDV